MKRWALLLSAAAIVIVANSVVLSRAARNRAGEPESEVELTERELRLEPGVGVRRLCSATGEAGQVSVRTRACGRVVGGHDAGWWAGG